LSTNFYEIFEEWDVSLAKKPFDSVADEVHDLDLEIFQQCFYDCGLSFLDLVHKRRYQTAFVQSTCIKYPHKLRILITVYGRKILLQPV